MKGVLHLLAVLVVLCVVPGSRAGSNCGNDVYEPEFGEECDDGNLANGDGCSSTCVLENCGNGSIDPYEECDDAQGQCCERCHYVPNFTFCRSAQGDCDLDDYCTGQDAECIDFKKDDGELCRGVNGVCDYPESCDGSSPDCPPDTYLFDDNEPCRAAAYECDADEYCTGDSPDCPPDGEAEDDAPCNDGDACTTDDACDGGACTGSGLTTEPACYPPPTGMVSWWPAEGTPEDIVGDNDGTLLNETGYDAGRVEQAFGFDGSGDGILIGDRPTLRLTNALTIDAWIYFYDVPNAVYAAIVSKWFQGPSAAYLFVVEQAGGQYRLRAHFRLAGGSEPSILGGTLLPLRWYHVAVTYDVDTGNAALWVDGHAVATSAIATEPLSAGAADFSIGFENDFTGRYFNGLIDEVEVFSRALSATELLLIHDACGTGKCRYCTGDADCNDHNSCTDDTCANASCLYTPDDSNDCSEDNQCTINDVCRAGLCVCSADTLRCALNGDPCDLCFVDCDDHVACTVDSCDPSSGCSNAPDASLCNDDNPCTDDTCDPPAGCAHRPSSTGSCDDDNVCTLEECADGRCVYTPVSCDDHNACTADECHSDLGCVYSPIACDDDNACTVDSCDPESGCQYQQIACSDSDKCTVDSCDPGTGCTYTPKVCAPSDSCHGAGTCNPSTGACSNPQKPNGSTCDDGNACTRTDTCSYGTCRGSNGVRCTAQDSCHSAGVCDRTTGQCSNPVKANGTTCSDGTLCTKYDKCQSGVCTGTPVVCAPPDSCHDQGACNPSTGYCSNPAKPNGSACNDGNACTRADTCTSGYCRGADPVVCTASDSCHKAGVCNTTTGVCSDPIKPNGSSCSDGNSCTVNDTCQSGLCRPGAPPRCSPCTLNGDATVKQSNQYSNFGYLNELQARGTTPAWGLLRFHVTGVTGQPVTGVHVLLTVKSASSTSAGSIHKVPCTWYESSVTWVSKPALGAAIDTEGAVVQGQVVDFDVSSVVTADGDYCFAVDNPAGADVLYYSREAATGRPQIRVDGACTCAP